MDLGGLRMLIDGLQGEGESLTPADLMRVSRALRQPGPWTVDRLRITLRALLTRGPEDFLAFDRAFLACFEREADLKAALAECGLALDEPVERTFEPRVSAKKEREKGAPLSPEKELEAWCQLLRRLASGETLSSEGEGKEKKTQTYIGVREKRSVPPGQAGARAADAKRRWRTFLKPSLGLAVLVVLLFTLSQRPWSTQPDGDEAPAVHDATAESEKESRKTGRTLGAPAFDLGKLEGAPIQPPLPWRSGLLSLAALLALAFYGYRLRKLLKEPTSPSRTQPAEVCPFRLRAPPGVRPWISDEALEQLAEALGHARTEERSEALDVPATVEATSEQGGLPALRFQRLTRPRRLLLLRDPDARYAGWHPLAEELARGLQRRGIELREGYFNGDPSRFRTADGLQTLEALEEEAESWLLLLVGEAERFPRSRSARRRLRRELAPWPRVFFLELGGLEPWGPTAAQLFSAGIAMESATDEGIRRIASALTRGRAEGKRAEADIAAEPGEVSALGPAWLWAAACALWTPLSLPVILWLRELLLQKKPGLRLPMSALLRIVALPESRWTSAGLCLAPAIRQAQRERLREREPMLEKVLVTALLDRVRALRPEDGNPSEEDFQRRQDSLELLLCALEERAVSDPLLERLGRSRSGPYGKAYTRELRILVPDLPDSAERAQVDQGMARLRLFIARWTGFDALWREQRLRRLAEAMGRVIPLSPRLRSRHYVWSGGLLALALAGLLPFLSYDWGVPPSRLTIELPDETSTEVSWGILQLYRLTEEHSTGRLCPGPGCSPLEQGISFAGASDLPLTLDLPSSGRYQLRLEARGGSSSTDLEMKEGYASALPLTKKITKRPCYETREYGDKGVWRIWRCGDHAAPGFFKTRQDASLEGALRSVVLLISGSGRAGLQSDAQALASLLIDRGSADEVLWLALGAGYSAPGPGAEVEEEQSFTELKEELARGLREFSAAMGTATQILVLVDGPAALSERVRSSFAGSEGGRWSDILAFASDSSSTASADGRGSRLGESLEAAEPGSVSASTSSSDGRSSLFATAMGALISRDFPPEPLTDADLIRALAADGTGLLKRGRSRFFPQPLPPELLFARGDSGPEGWRLLERLPGKALQLFLGDGLDKVITPTLARGWLEFAGATKASPRVSSRLLGPCWAPDPVAVERPDREGLPLACVLQRPEAKGWLLRARASCSDVLGRGCPEQGAVVDHTPRPLPRSTPTPEPVAELSPTPLPTVESQSETPSPTPIAKGTPAPQVGINAAGEVDFTWITIPGGDFLMGSEDGYGDEKPVHQVTVPTFKMSRTEITNAQYQACVGEGSCTAPDWSNCVRWSEKRIEAFQGTDQPVVCVDWNQARVFARWAKGRLPTEAEWEYAARSGGKNIKYPWGDQSATCEYAVMNDGGNGCGHEAPWSVCSKVKGNSAQGLCDMAGNAWEWVEDCYQDSYENAPSDGSARQSCGGSYRVLRGGSWNFASWSVRAANRFGNRSGNRNDLIGFRVVRPASHPLGP